MQQTEKTKISTEMIRKEINFLRYPYFALSTKGLKNKQRTEVHRIIRQGDEELEIYWKVNAHPDYGYPGPLAKKFNSYVEYLVSQMPYPITNPIRLGSSYQICKAMQVPADQWHYKAVRKCIVQTITTTIETKHTYFRKRKKQWVEEVFHLYDHLVRKGDYLDNGTIADTNYLYLNNWYIENLNAKFIKLMDQAYLKSLELPTSQRLYEILDLSFYAVINNPDILYIQYPYSLICELLPLKRQRHFSRARQQFDAAHEELLRTKFLAKVEWVPIPGLKNDWYLRYWPGERYYDEVSRFNNGHKTLPAPVEICNPDVADISEATDDKGSLDDQHALSFLTNCECQEAFDSEGKSTQPSKDIVETQQSDISLSERYWLSLLKSIPAYPFKHEKDLDFIRELLEDFPNLNLGDEIKDWKTWLMDNNLDGNVNYRSRLRRWLKNSKRYMEERYGGDYEPNKYADVILDGPGK